MSKLLTRAETAEMLRVAPDTLGAWAREGKGPVPFRLGPKKIFYAREDIEKWIQERKDAAKTQPESQSVEAAIETTNTGWRVSIKSGDVTKFLSPAEVVAVLRLEVPNAKN